MREHSCSAIVSKRESKYPHKYPEIVFTENEWELRVDGGGDWDFVRVSIVICPFCGAVLAAENEK